MQVTRTISRKTKQLRRSKNLTAGELATKSGLSLRTIKRVEGAEETGYTPHLATLNQLARGLNVTLGDFLASPRRVQATV